MKKITLIYSFLFSALLMFSCDPIEDRQTPGGIVPASDFKLETYPIIVDNVASNKIVMKNSTYGVGSFWDFGSGYSARQQDTVIVPFVGNLPIIFTGISNGGTDTKTERVQVDKIVFPVDETWNLLAGYDINGKTWMWDFNDPNDPVFGNGGTSVDLGPAWAKNSAQSMDTNDPTVGMNGTMTFDLNMKANYTKKNGNGDVVEISSFSFDMKKKILSADGVTNWSIGQLTLPNATVMRGTSPNAGDIAVHTYEIIKLTEDEMVLATITPGKNNWESWFWKFKVKK